MEFGNERNNLPDLYAIDDLENFFSDVHIQPFLLNITSI